jgi:ferredoxin--NADP+ reductase
MNPRYVVAIVGGATAGAETAALLAERGVVAVVFEQNTRPYGKIEDGLPRWHEKLRQKEYATIDANLDRAGVLFVPSTKVGRDIDFRELVSDWGFTAVILAHGAWRDRRLPVEGADEYVDRGLIYQNPFIHWFNHFPEPGYDGPRYEVEDGAIVVGGGLASIDVAKVLQIEVVRAALGRRGIEEDALRIEHAGIPAVLAEHDLGWESLGLSGATLFYRRRLEDMPLLEMPEGADASRRQKVEATRRKIIDKAMQKYLFRVQPQRLPSELLVEGGRAAGLRFRHTRLEGGQVVVVPGAVDEVRAPLIVSSIGSVPEPMGGVPQRGELYDYVDRDLGRLRGYDTVFSTGNVVTGKGNIVASRRHSIETASHLIERFLGLGDGDHAGEEKLLEPLTGSAAARAREMAEWVGHRPAARPADVEAILRRVRQRQKAIGYTTYSAWIERFTSRGG